MLEKKGISGLKESILYLSLALLVFAPSCAFVPLKLYYLLIPIVLYTFKNELLNFALGLPISLKNISLNAKLVVSITLFSFINRLFHAEAFTFRELYSGAYFLPILFLFTRLISHHKFYVFFISLILLESLVGISEWIYGVSTFFESLQNFEEFFSRDLLYNTRVLGLSNNSSLLAEKVFVGVFLVRNLKVRFWIKSIVSLIFYVTLILTFNRSVMVGALVYEICFFAIALYQNNNRKQLIYIWVTIGAILLLLSPEIKRQFLRESSGVSTMSTLKEYHTNNQPEKAEKLIAVMVEKTKSKEFKKMGNEYLSAKNKEEKYEILDNYFYEKTKRAAFSGRTDIWNRYIEFIKNHVWFGNGSTRLVDKHSDHAHSIYLNLMAMHGIFLFVFMFFIIFKNINSYNMAFICGILAIGVFQTVIFWGGSVIDILFYSILFYKPKSIV